MQHAEDVIKKLCDLRELGVRLAIDDFGTGYSSLSYLARLPVDVLKIAKPFVDGIERGSEELALVRAIVRMSESLGLRTIAEGIERAEQRDRLRELGCDLGQGFLFAKPLEREAVEGLLTLEGGELRVLVEMDEGGVLPFAHRTALPG